MPFAELAQRVLKVKEQELYIYRFASIKFFDLIYSSFILLIYYCLAVM